MACSYCFIKKLFFLIDRLLIVWLLCGYCVVIVWLLCGYCVEQMKKLPLKLPTSKLTL